MESTGIMRPEYITLELRAGKKQDAIKELIAMLAQEGVVTDKEEMLKAVLKREEEFSTGIGFNIAIPHAKTNVVTRASVAVGVSKQGVYWPGDDCDTANLIFLVAVPMEAENQHLRLLASISRKLIHSEIREQILHAATEKEIIQALEESKV